MNGERRTDGGQRTVSGLLFLAVYGTYRCKSAFFLKKYAPPRLIIGSFTIHLRR